MSDLPTNAADRKALPVVTGVLDYFPLAIAAIAEVSRVGNEQHNPGEPLHWARGKSTDHADCLVRHLMERGTFDTDELRHTAKVAWRALALLQTELEEADVPNTRAVPYGDPGIYRNTPQTPNAREGRVVKVDPVTGTVSSYTDVGMKVYDEPDWRP